MTLFNPTPFYKALDLAASFYHRELPTLNQLNGPFGHVDLRHRLLRLGFSQEVTEQFKLGFAPISKLKIGRIMHDSNIGSETLIQAGVCRQGKKTRPYYTFKAKLIFPIFNKDGLVIGMAGRRLIDKEDKGPKYINTAESPIFKKGHVLYGYHLAKEAIVDKGRVILMEGYTDVIQAHNHGYAESVGIMGTGLTPHHCQAIAEDFPPHTEIILAFDGDNAGIEATKRALKVCMQNLPVASVIPSPYGVGVVFHPVLFNPISIAPVPQGEDPESIIRADPDRWEAIMALRLPYYVFLLKTLIQSQDGAKFAKEKSRIVSQIAPYLISLRGRPDDYHAACGLVARELDLSRDTVTHEIGLRGSRAINKKQMGVISQYKAKPPVKGVAIQINQRRQWANDSLIRIEDMERDRGHV